MSWLLFDAGNTALKWRTAARGHDGSWQLAGGGALAGGEGLADELAAALKAEGRGPVDAAFGCSVAGAAAVASVGDAVRRVAGTDVTWFGSQPEFSFGGVVLRSGYRDPAQLGADRWHALLAAREQRPGEALVVVNAGTATTVDCVTADGRFAGGVIAPGVRLMFDSLARHTAQLPLADGRRVAHPDNTDDAITTGVLDCQLGLIERRVRAFVAESGKSPVCVLVDGGNAAALREHLALGAQATVAAARDLVLRGVLLRARALERP